MTLKGTIEISININKILVKRLMRQGYIRYALSLSYIDNSNVKNYCHPYNIMKLKTNLKQQQKLPIDSQIDSYCQYFYSPAIFVKYHDDNYTLDQTYYFKAYIDTQILHQIHFTCQALLLFSQDYHTEFRTLCTYTSRIFKIYNISTYLPIVFDDLGGLQICGSYHATILEFKFEKLQENIKENNKYDDFESYVSAVSQGFNYNHIRTFYNFYRGIIEQQFINLQERHEKIKYLINKKKYNKNLNLKEAFLKPISENNLKAQQLSPNIQLLTKMQLLSKKINQISGKQIELTITDLILKDFTIIKAYIYQKWNQLNQIILEHSDLITDALKHQYELLVKDRFKNNIFSHIVKNHDYTFSKYEDSTKLYIQYATKQKQKHYENEELWKQNFPIQDIKFLGHDLTNIKIFQEVFYPNQIRIRKNSFENQTNLNKIINQQKKNLKKHLIILVHGFQASRLDFLLLKSCLQIHYEVQVLLSVCNQGRTDQSLDILGKRLAIEVSNHLNTLDKDFKLSFIGHSMGGLIIRSALQFLANLQQRLYCYISMCTPHLGYLYQTSKLIQAGLWVLNTWQKCPSITQLCLIDNQNLKECYLYKMSKNKTLGNFKKLAFICSSQDQYVPYESARIEKNIKLLQQLNNNQNSLTICEMVDNILKGIKAEELSRINVIFNIMKSDFDTFIGRTGHVLFLSDSQFIKQFVICFGKYFE